MPPTFNTRKTRLWLITGLLIATVALSATQSLDNTSAELANQALKRSLVTFAIARTLNGAISVAQGTEVALEPAGVGLILAAGELLDPINDLVERFSWIMLAASTSLGIQKVLLTISAWWGITLLLALSAVAFLWMRWRGVATDGKPSRFARRALVVMLFARFAMPLLVVVNQQAFEIFLADNQQTATEALRDTRDGIRQIGARPPAPAAQRSLTERMGDLFDSGVAMLDMEARLEKLRDTLSGASERIIDLIVLFTLETILFPLFFLWLFLRAFRFATGD